MADSREQTRVLLFNELRRLTAAWNGRDDAPEEEKMACRAVGELLFFAYCDTKSANPNVYILQDYWDGIGDWR